MGFINMVLQTLVDRSSFYQTMEGVCVVGQNFAGRAVVGGVVVCFVGVFTNVLWVIKGDQGHGTTGSRPPHFGGYACYAQVCRVNTSIGTTIRAQRGGVVVFLGSRGTMARAIYENEVRQVNNSAIRWIGLFGFGFARGVGDITFATLLGL